MSGHTPGPWKLETEARSPDGSDLIIVTPDGADTIASCRIGATGIFDVEEAEANARLIRAAPELLALLKESLQDAPTYASALDWAQRAEAAIRAAEEPAP